MNGMKGEKSKEGFGLISPDKCNRFISQPVGQVF
jgi:hypothetical protein